METILVAAKDKAHYKKNIGLIAWNMSMTIGLIILLLALSYLYSINIKEIVSVFDYWFGNDTVRYIQWITEPQYVDRYHLHPLSFLLYKFYGWFLLNSHILPENNLLPILSFPVILYTSFSIIFTVNLLLPFYKFPTWIRFMAFLMLVIIGPVLIFAPVPESHLLGGASLLMQAVLVWHYLKLNNSTGISTEELNFKKKKSIYAITFFAVLATGFTLSNLMPAVILMVAIPNLRPLILKTGAFIFCFLSCFYLVHHFLFHFEFISPIRRMIMMEISWLTAPDLSTLRFSINNLLLEQFGISSPRISSWTSPSGEENILVSLTSATYFQIFACLLYLSGIIVWMFQNKGKNHFELNFIFYCTFAFISLMAFHNLYAVNESYIFSAHGWPFLVLPGIIVLKNSWNTFNRKIIVCILFALLISLIQLSDGIYKLLHLSDM